MLKSETEVFQFRFHLIQAQAVGKGGIDIECLTGNLILFVGWLRLQCSHIMKSVADLDEDDADIVTHRQQQFLEVLCLGRGLFTEDATANLCQAINNLGNFRAEDVLDVVNGIVGILYDIVEQGRADAGRT